MNGDNGFGPCRNQALHLLQINKERIRVTIRQNRKSSRMVNGLNSSDKGVSCRNDLVPGSDIQRLQRQINGVCPIGNANPILRAGIAGEGLLKPGNRHSPDEYTPGCNLLYLPQPFIPD
ncbi:hypothetical protein D3C73_1269640 [compost metagenome]